MTHFSTLPFSEKINTLQLAERHARHVPELASYASEVLYQYRLKIREESYEPMTEDYYRFRLCHTWGSLHYVLNNRPMAAVVEEDGPLLTFIESVVEKCLSTVPWKERFKVDMEGLETHQKDYMRWKLVCDTLYTMEVGEKPFEEVLKELLVTCEEK